MGWSGLTLSVFIGGKGDAFSLEVYSGESKLLVLAEFNICRRENFFLALSKVLIILFSVSTLVSADGGVIGISGLDSGHSVADWSPWSETPSSLVCFSIEGISPGALEGLVVKSAYVGAAPLSVLTFDALDDLKGSSKPFLLILVCGRTSLTDSGSSLCSFLAGGSIFSSFPGRTGSTRGMCLFLRDCFAESSSLATWEERELC